jgi:hypothetical protein
MQWRFIDDDGLLEGQINSSLMSMNQRLAEFLKNLSDHSVYEEHLSHAGHSDESIAIPPLESGLWLTPKNAHDTPIASDFGVLVIVNMAYHPEIWESMDIRTDEFSLIDELADLNAALIQIKPHIAQFNTDPIRQILLYRFIQFNPESAESDINAFAVWVKSIPNKTLKNVIFGKRNNKKNSIALIIKGINTAYIYVKQHFQEAMHALENNYDAEFIATPFYKWVHQADRSTNNFTEQYIPALCYYAVLACLTDSEIIEISERYKTEICTAILKLNHDSRYHAIGACLDDSYSEHPLYKIMHHKRSGVMGFRWGASKLNGNLARLRFTRNKDIKEIIDACFHEEKPQQAVLFRGSY